MQILKSRVDLEKMRVAGKLAAETLQETGKMVKEGISTAELDAFARDFIGQFPGAKSAALNYQGFPKSICTSVNEVVCHGVPKKEDILQAGSIVNIDVTVLWQGFHGDTSAMFTVGNEIASETRALIERTKEAMWQGFATVKHGSQVSDIGVAIENFISPFNYGIVREYTGHGLGRSFHEEPSIPHFRQNSISSRLVAGMALTVEPMINQGSFETILDSSDGWTVRTKDGSLSAQFEHTCFVAEDGCEILTII